MVNFSPIRLTFLLVQIFCEFIVIPRPSCGAQLLNVVAWSFLIPIEKLVREGKEQYRALVSGKKSLAGARKAHEMVHGTEAEKTAHWNKMQKWCNDLHSEHPDWSFEAIKRHISRNSEKVLGKEVSTKTVYRRCKNPKK